MSESIVVEGKTTAAAIEKGLKKLNVSKDDVEIKILEEGEKRSFYSILTPRIVKVELTVKKENKNNSDELKENEEKEQKKCEATDEEKERAIKNLEEFLNKFLDKSIKRIIEYKDNKIMISIEGKDLNYLIGYRGETINSIQNILFAIANKNIKGHIKICLDIDGYRKKREKTLQELADKVARTVIRTGKSIALEPMSAYERKIIHSQLHDNKRVKTVSKGEEPYRKIIIMLK